MTNPLAGATSQPPHVPTLVWAVGGFVVLLIAYHVIHKH
jgi:uncharacterized membrane protein YjfL (UPF0719 family)